MSGTRTAEPPTIDQMGFNTRFGDAGVQASEHGNMPALQPAAGHQTDAAMAQIITAQRCAVKRDMPRILKEIDEAALVAGDDWYYRWETKNRDGTRGQVLGASIKCAMAIANIWGNCRVEAFPAAETATHWTFLARFIDYEKGVTITRSFQQRKSQRAGGKMGDDRAQDMAFQIGQSKAMRNVVVAALGVHTDRGVETALRSAFKWITDNLEKARDVVLQRAVKAGVPVKVMEQFVARPQAGWLAPDILTLGAKLQSIMDGMDDVDSAFGLVDEDGDALPPLTATTSAATAAPTEPATSQAPTTDQEPEKRRATRARPAKPAEATKAPEKEPDPPPVTKAADPEPEPSPADDGDQDGGPPAGMFQDEDPPPRTATRAPAEPPADDDTGELEFE